MCAGQALAMTEANMQRESTAVAMATSSPDIQGVLDMLTGSWKTSAGVPGADGEESVDLVMNIAPITVKGVDNALYIELARADASHAPYRQAIFQVYRYHDSELRLRTYEFRIGLMPVLTGLWLAPESFPELSGTDLIATLDITLEQEGNGWTGRTPYPYPTGTGNAVEMTSEITIMPDSIESVDRGFAADGSIAWGSEEGMRYTFNRAEPTAVLQRLADDVLVIDFYEGDGDVAVEGDQISVHYTGLTGDGNKFDSSFDHVPPDPFTFPWPGQMIQGWNTGMQGVSVGLHRKLVIPGPVAYGEQGNPRAKIGPNATLYFDIEVMSVQHKPAAEATPEVAPEAEPAAQPDATGHEGHNHP